MKPPEEVKRTIAAEWLRTANADFELAEHLLAEGTAFPITAAHGKPFCTSWRNAGYARPGSASANQILFP
jgi:hypothetical protein